MSTNQMRDILKRTYPSAGWRSKVEKMSDRQVGAIYQRLLHEKKL